MLMKNTILAKARALANIMSPRGDVGIKLVKGGTPFATKDAIHIPEGDWSDPNYLALVEWYINHELGHIKFTDFSTLPRIVKYKFLMNLTNAVEDARMEKEVINEYPGMEIENAAGVNIWKQEGKFSTPQPDDSPMQLVFSYVLYKGRSSIGQNLLEEANLALTYIRQQAGDEFADKLVDIMSGLDQCKHTDDAIRIAEKVLELLQDESEDQDDENDESDDSDDNSEQSNDDESSDSNSDSSDSGDGSENDSGDGSSDDDGADGDDSGDSDDGQGSGSEGEDDSNQDGNGGQGEGDSQDDGDTQNESGEGDQSGDENSAQSGSGNGSDKAQQFAEAALEEGKQADVEDLHKELQETIGEMAEEARNEGRAGIQCDGEFQPLDIVNTLPDGIGSVSHNAERYSQSIGQAFNQHRLTKKGQVTKRYDRSGKRVDASKIAGVNAGNFNVFVNPTERRNLGFNLALLVDVSVSMKYKGNIDLANDAAYGVMKGLQPHRDVKTACYHYPVANSIIETKGWLQPVSKDMAVPAIGSSTPTGEALQSILMRMISFNASGEKVVCVITDGRCNEETVKAAKQLANEMGVHLVAIGIGVSEVSGFDESNSVCISDCSELQSKLSELVLKNFA